MNIIHAGFCVVCGVSIDWNINSPFCKICCEFLITKTSRFNRCELTFCHGCGCNSKNITVEYPLCKMRCRPFDRDSALNDDIYIQRLNRYKQLKGIHSIWDSSPRADSIVINEYCISDLLSVIEDDGLNTNDVFDNSISSNKRIMNTLWMWEFGLPISLPILNKDDNYLIDGRHRILAASHLDERKIPIYCQTKRIM